MLFGPNNNICNSDIHAYVDRRKLHGRSITNFYNIQIDTGHKLVTMIYFTVFIFKLACARIMEAL